MMLTFDESEIIYGLGIYSSVTTSLKYSGLNETWIQSKGPYSTHSKPSMRSHPVKSVKLTSTALPTRPSDLDDAMVLEDKRAPLLLAKNANRGQKPPAPPVETSQRELSITALLRFA